MARRGMARLPRALAVTVVLPALMGSAAALAADMLRDPTQPWAPRATEPAAPAPRYAVSAIFVSSFRSVAILNGRRVGVGDEIEGVRVVAIERDAVTLEVGEERLRVTPAGRVSPAGN